MTDPLFVDCYPLDGPKDWNKFIAAGPPWHGAVFKLSQGVHFEYAQWARQQRQPFLRSPRYGVDLFDGFYHYLDFSQDGRKQADWFWLMVGIAGGERAGTLWAMVDAERGGQHTALTRGVVEDVVTAFAERYHELSGRRATLYGGELLRSIGARGLYRCGRSALALYGATLPRDIVLKTGTDYEHLAFWQYDGDGEAYLPGYPKEAPGCGKVDISALVLPGGLTALRTTLTVKVS